MKRIQYTGTSSLSRDTIVGKAWSVGEAYITDDLTAANLVALGTFKDTTGLTPSLGSAVAATKTISMADAGVLLPITTSSTVTIPASCPVDQIEFVILSSGSLTLKGATGVTLNGTSAGTVTYSTLNSSVRVSKVGTDTYLAQTVGADLSIKLDVSSKASDALVDAGTDDATYMTPAKTTRALSRRMAATRVANVAELRAISDSSLSYVYLDGYDSLGDGGQGYVRVVSDRASFDDGGVQFLDSLGRVWERDLRNGSARLEHYGIFPVPKRTSTVSQSLLDTNTTRWAAACDGIVKRGGGELVGSVGYYHVNGVGIIQDPSNLSENPSGGYENISITLRGPSRRFVMVQNHPTETLLRVVGPQVSTRVSDVTFAGRGSATTGDLIEYEANVGSNFYRVDFLCHGGVAFAFANSERMFLQDCRWMLCRKAYRFVGAVNETYIINQQILNAGLTQDSMNGNLNRKSYSVNVGANGYSLKTTGTFVQDQQVAFSVVGSQNVRMIGGSIKTTQHVSGGLVRSSTGAIQFDNIYFEGYNGGVNPALIVGGRSEKTTLSADVSATDTTIPVADLFNFPWCVTTRSSATFANSQYWPTTRYVIYDPANTATYEYIDVKILDWQAKTPKGVTRGVGGTTARAWPTGSIFRELYRSNVNSMNGVAYVDNCHLNSYQKAPDGCTLSYDAAKGETIGEIIVGSIPDEFNLGTQNLPGGRVIINEPDWLTGGSPYKAFVQHWANGVSNWPSYNHTKALSYCVGPINADGSKQTSLSTYGEWSIISPSGQSKFPSSPENHRIDMAGAELLYYSNGVSVPVFMGRGGVGFSDTVMENTRVLSSTSGSNTATLVAPGTTTLSVDNVGTTISHPGFPAGTTITAISGSTLTLSNNATSTLTEFVKIHQRWMSRYSYDGAYGQFEILQNTGNQSSQSWRSMIRLAGGYAPTVYFYDPSNLRQEKVITVRQKGWSADTGTARKASNATYVAPTASASYSQSEMQAVMTALQNATQTIKALKDTLISHGLIGNAVLQMVVDGTTAVLTIPAANVTLGASTADISVGMTATGTGIPANATVVSKTSSTVTLSANTTAAGTVNVTFTS